MKIDYLNQIGNSGWVVAIKHRVAYDPRVCVGAGLENGRRLSVNLLEHLAANESEG